MDIQLNIRNATKSVKDFIAVHGGLAKHSEVLELVAKIAGFDSYRALKAQSEKKPINNDHVSATGSNRDLENHAFMVYKGAAVDWELEDNPSATLAEIPLSRRTKFDVCVEHQGSQYRVLMKPEGTNIDNFEGLPVLDMLIEINNGVPCVHLTNDPADANALTVFATGDGLIVRPDDCDWTNEKESSLPEAVLEFVEQVSDRVTRRDVCVALLDTKLKYADTPKAAPDESTKPLQTHTDPESTDNRRFEKMRAFKVYHESTGLTTLSESIGHSEFPFELSEALLKYVKMIQDDNLKGTYRIFEQIETSMGVWLVLDDAPVIVISDGFIKEGTWSVGVEILLRNLRLKLSKPIDDLTEEELSHRVAFKVEVKLPGATLYESIGASEYASETYDELVSYVKMIQDNNKRGTFLFFEQTEVDKGVWEVLDSTPVAVVADGVIVEGLQAHQLRQSLNEVRQLEKFHQLKR